MRPIDTRGTRVLAETLGAQLAWWQLGFAVRRAVLHAARRGIPFPDLDVRQVAAAWARQQLAPPRWWSLVRDVGATVLAVVCAGALVSVLAEVDGLVALSGAATVCVPLAVWRVARHAGNARLLAPGGRMSVRGSVLRALAVLAVAGSSATALVVAIAEDRSFAEGCPRVTIDPAVADWWARERMGCPAGDTATGADGLRYTPWTVLARNDGRLLDYVVYVSPGTGTYLLPAAIFAAWRAEGGPSGPLGPPTFNAGDDHLQYANFRGGAIVVPPGGTVTVHIGRRYTNAREPSAPCVPVERPCVTSVRAVPGGVRLGWQYGAADAFNVAWWPRDEPRRVTHREVAGYTLTVGDLRPSTEYVVEVGACQKRFLRSSVCTWPSAPVIVRAG